jgi:hypothetical protein
LLLLLGTPQIASAQVVDTAVKAAFLPRFARYVEWPSAARPPGNAAISLCILGSDPFGAVLDRAAESQLAEGQRIFVRRIDGQSSSSGCHIAFVSGSRTLPAGQILAALADRPVLTVTDAANGGARGIIHFQVVSGRVRFAIDAVAARRKGINISSRLLALATDVRQR